ncbi:transposase [Desulfocicer niacini]
MVALDDSINPKSGKQIFGRPRQYGRRLGFVADCAACWKEKCRAYMVFLYGKTREVQAFSQIFMLKTMKCPVRVVFVYRKTRYVASMTTDITLSVEQIIEYYGTRWQIESEFKEIKQEIGNSKSQIRNAESLLNHLSF